ncbi:MAG: tRNA (adenosine(37)-N6)-threonylcarbamoyltransferase complex dimerization subunit type 1 TsaB [Candidatus Lambdaproteobacteria bacterium]|nr:tRNA (adenosine(37)-N6)-threonylcarbamoyltransferase complex dimerization subunit type 1 TsaB [Candidatus Lambdaproteobacteria bacterium]
MTRALAIDTTSDYMSLALHVDDASVGSRYELSGARMNAALLPAIGDMLDAAGLTPRALDVIVVARGPGSFTGTRLGLAVALTFAQVLGTPVVGVDTLQVLAAQTEPSLAGTFHALLHCTRSEVYHAPFRWTAAGLPEAQAPTALDPIARMPQLIGAAPVVLRRHDGLRPLRPEAQAALDSLRRAPLRHAQPDALRLLAVGLPRYLSRPAGPFPAVQPLYLKSEAFRRWEERP